MKKAGGKTGLWILLAVIVAAVVGFGTWWYMDSAMDDKKAEVADLEDDVTALEKQVADLKSDLEDAKEDSENVSSFDATETEESSLVEDGVYTNTALGYTLEIPESWEGNYSVSEEELLTAKFDYIDSDGDSHIFFSVNANREEMWNFLVREYGDDFVPNCSDFKRLDDIVFSKSLGLENPFDEADPDNEIFSSMAEELPDVLESLYLN